MATTSRALTADTRHVLRIRERRKKNHSYLNSDPALAECRRWIEVSLNEGIEDDQFNSL